MGKRIRLFAFAVLFFASVYRAEAQQATKIPRIGYLTNTAVSALSDRTLAYVFREDGTLLNAEIIKQGYGLRLHALSVCTDGRV